ncbi:hypothetical protein CEXT_93301 [Caerostris extrusa]|uniref:Uncharacterized protein n=1 Tax=Caerostris extrusa TaxID=172846 RepID=A0AAV4N853_CAEEX|nr:hypothetical protein CEXT_93301 [Caerostris extrusa]
MRTLFQSRQLHFHSGVLIWHSETYSSALLCRCLQISFLNKVFSEQKRKETKRKQYNFETWRWSPAFRVKRHNKKQWERFQKDGILSRVNRRKGIDQEPEPDVVCHLKIRDSADKCETFFSSWNERTEINLVHVCILFRDDKLEKKNFQVLISESYF